MEYLLAQAKAEEKVNEAVVVVEDVKVEKAQGIDGGLVGLIVLVAISLNIFLGAVSKILEKFKDMTESQLDNSIYKWVNIVSKFLHKLIDFVGMNPEHKKEEK